MGTLEDYMNCTLSYEIHRYLFSAVYILVLLVGLPANLYSLYHAWQQLRARNELGVYLLNLTVSDLLYMASLPIWLQYFFQGDNWMYNEWLCQLCGLLLYENIYISIGFLCCISIDRYLAIVYPFGFTKFRTMRAAIIASALIWLKELAVGVNFFNHKEVTPAMANQSVCFEHYPMKEWERSINFYRFFVGFLFPLGILSMSYLRVLRAVNKSVGTQSSQKRRIKQLVSSTIVIFLVCFSPYHLFLLVRTVFEDNCDFIESIFNYYHFALVLTSFNCLTDPLLYCFVSENAQRDMQWAQESCLRLVCCKRVDGPDNTTDVPVTIQNSTGVILVEQQPKQDS
ncbi:ovarian cancer G-protein coupled receptor 1 [Brienomyrus brachyistius]|uniref:ovarian cancer G-protein coupled receptor 1 n=1 Tax=Brienomyrus brachyistius TaxID=42636 RepID=UPI0020B1DE9D|nr:ovarian cancer G-protein coupled receptor 1 [Brienomyrus brachyistius]XP_048830279.1 ovarian cancer G-protein coupled receptor 1 [Brienomyrus brachyistius]XP_048830280.1 ovarian cancer G-protein coupled receptor 1 [Brienomyrus brachyistius]